MKTLNDLFLDTLADMYDAEMQITKALPKMSMAAQSAELKEALDAHLEETEGHIELVQQVFACFDLKARSKKCKATEGLLEEGESLVKDFDGSPALDAAIISAAQKVEHYEMATYGCLHTWAELLGNEEAADLLAGILEEEKQADATLNELALAQCNEEALNGESDEGLEADDGGGKPSRQPAAAKRSR